MPCHQQKCPVKELTNHANPFHVIVCRYSIFFPWMRVDHGNLPPIISCHFEPKSGLKTCGSAYEYDSIFPISSFHFNASLSSAAHRLCSCVLRVWTPA